MKVDKLTVLWSYGKHLDVHLPLLSLPSTTKI